MKIFDRHFGNSSFLNYTRLRVKLFVILAAFSFAITGADIYSDDSLVDSNQDGVCLIKATVPIIRAAIIPKTDKETELSDDDSFNFSSTEVFFINTVTTESHFGRSPPRS